MTREPIPVTAIVSTKDEEIAITRCLDGLQEFAQVVVVDSMSSDRTVELAKTAGAEVVSFDWNGRYPKKKQWCLENLDISQPWVLFVDADERPDADLLSAMRSLASGSDSPRAYDLDIAYYFMGRRLKHGHKVVKRALLRPDSVRFPELGDASEKSMGELEGHYQPTVQGSVGTLQGRIEHLDPDPYATWVTRHNKYSDWEAFLRTHPEQMDLVRGLRSRQGQLFDRMPFKPAAFFIYCYVVRLGFLDGRAGYDYAVGLAWYYWLIGVKTREATKQSPRQ